MNYLDILGNNANKQKEAAVLYLAENVALHENGIEIYQKVNGGISFHLPVQENSVRRRTMLYDVKQFF